ncbi:DUF815 domain-containing protein [Sphingomonas sp.]|jgi:hypothetical protein|uniref:DUF815 domain-containing protein n=1 Tax=Sphingomonas sp. TaxID=28214 RepID=UPI002D805E43|nr:DUF815 domain-containing protein [Sphingomonas sp.]HEU0045954.1 DUF815 domain-containing protein [Sphingomonas sp.]
MDALERIAAALERLSPPPLAPADLLAHAAYTWRAGRLHPILLEALPLDRLLGLDRQRDALFANLTRLAQGHAAHDILLWGARGSGKSALAKAAVAAVQGAHPALALVVAGEIGALPALFGELAGLARPMAVFVDDVGVDAPGDARALRSLLEGGAEPRPRNARLLVTANRRHLLPRDMAEQAINPRDAADDQLALADRFGLSLGFHALDQDGYLAIVARDAQAHGLAWQPAEALEWAQRRGSRSGRVAAQFVVELAGRAGRSIG